MLHIALAKGRVAKQVMEYLQQGGVEFPAYSKDSRKLIFEDAQGLFKITLVKSPDVPVYVEWGAADIGVVGKDVLLEEPSDIYEIYKLKLGICRMAVAKLQGTSLPTDRRLVIASKYPQIAKQYFAEQRQAVDIVKLNGSVELAPLVGLADAIVDIVETGNTLRENGLEVDTFFMDISSRIIANKVAYKLKQSEIQTFLEILKAYV